MVEVGVEGVGCGCMIFPPGQGAGRISPQHCATYCIHLPPQLFNVDKEIFLSFKNVGLQGRIRIFGSGQMF